MQCVAPTPWQALTEMQIVQIFWSTLMLELVLICVQYEGPEEPGDEQEPLPLVSIIIAGLFTAGCTTRMGTKRRLGSAMAPPWMARHDRRLGGRLPLPGRSSLP